MKQQYVPYWDWEDFVNGMWTNKKPNNEDELINSAYLFTSDHVVYGAAMKEVIYEWPKTMIHNLTNKSINRKAFVGHCAVCYKIFIPEYITRIAWGMLTDRQRFDANAMADKNIKIWEHEYTNKNRALHKSVGTQMLFQWDSR